MKTTETKAMSQDEFRKITNEVAIERFEQPKHIHFKTISATRTKKAVNKLLEKGYNAAVNILDKKYLFVYK